MSKKANVAGTLAALLSKIQSRLDNVGRESRQNTDAIAVVKDDLRLKVGELSYQGQEFKDSANRHEYQILSVAERTKRLETEAKDREARQTLRDQNNVQSLVNLRDSTAKAFDGVKKDVETLMHQIQRLNERVGQVDSRCNAIAVQTLSAAAVKAQSGLPSDHIWLNKKLTGVYDVTDDLETRVQKLEKLVDLYEGLRKAQVALAEANGLFLAGPKV